jgi:hypothetical protein
MDRALEVRDRGEGDAEELLAGAGAVVGSGEQEAARTSGGSEDGGEGRDGQCPSP